MTMTTSSQTEGSCIMTMINTGIAGSVILATGMAWEALATMTAMIAHTTMKEHPHPIPERERGGKGKGVIKADPPMILSGIPHLQHSFVKTENGGKNGSASSSQVNESGEGPEMNASAAPFGEVQNASGPIQEGSGNSSCRENGKSDQEASRREKLPMGEETTPQGNNKFEGELQLETVDSEEEYDNVTPSSNAPQAATAAQPENFSASKDMNAESQTVLERSQEVTEPDPAKLELETERYYDELLGKNEGEKEEGTEILSASQVAKITVAYKTDEEQKKDEENQKKEEEKKAEERQAQIETAWSILHQYWQFVSENPYDFNGWTYLLNHVESMNNLEAARSAFEGFLPLYPYCFAYWKKISDMEMRHKNTERSLGILLIGSECVPFCTDLWVPLVENFISYGKGKSLEPQCIRVLYEYGLDSAGRGWHSSPLWETCINYEQHDTGDLVQVMGLYKRLLSTPTKLYNKHWDHFLAIIRDHHPRNLLSVEEYQKLRKETCEELKIKYTPCSMVPPKSVHKTPQPEDKLTSRMKEKLVASYIKAHEHNEEEVDKRWKFEERIKRPYFHVKPLDKKQLKNWNEYLDFEIGVGDPVRIIPLFERALVACALYEDMWCRYASYMEKHVQDIMDAVHSEQSEKKEKEVSDASGDKKEAEKAEAEEGGGESSENSAIASECIAKRKNCDDKSDENSQVNDESVVDVKDVKDRDDSGNRGSVANAQNESTRDDSSVGNSDQCNCDKDAKVCEVHVLSNCISEMDSASQNDQTGNEQRKKIVETEPQTYKQLKDKLSVNISMAERVLRCPPLTPAWIKVGVSWEDVRHTYRRGAWIHCPSKPRLLMQWAEFEETQGNLDTARELLSTVVAKHPTLLKARMQLIELERRAQSYQRVEELYAEASQVVTEPRLRSWLAIRYARFLFKILLEADRALVVLRKALKKDRGNVHVYHHVFDICYQRQPLDCQGVLASVMLALASKELSVHSKYWFAFKRVEFLREHGDIKELKKAQMEMEELKALVDEELAKKAKEEEEKKERDTIKSEGKDTTSGENASDGADGKTSANVNEEAATIGSEVTTAEANPQALQVPEAQPNQQFPVPYFAADGAITYTPMEGYGYGYSDPNQALPTAQEVVQGGGASVEQLDNAAADCHKVPPSWELNVQIGGYGYGKSDENRWHQDAAYHQYDELVSNGYPDHLKDSKTEEFKMPFQVSIDHLHRRPGLPPLGRMPDLSQPPPSAPGSMPPSGLPPPTDMPHSNLPPPVMPGVLPPKFTRPPPLPGLGGSGMMLPGYRAPGGPLDNLPPGERPPHPADRPYFEGPQPYGKRRHPGDYSSEDEPPYKMSHLDMDSHQYRPEYDNIYTNSPGPCAPPSHRAHLGSWDSDYGSYMPYGRRDGLHSDGLHGDQLGDRRDLAALRDSPELSRFNEAKRYSLRDEDNYSPIPRELGLQESDNMCVNVPKWLMQDGGELCLSETDRGVALIRYWPNFMTESGQMSIFRILRKGLKWHQRRALIEGKWQNLPHLLSWIGPCDYSYSGVTLEKNTNWLPEIVDLLHRLIRYTGNQYNSCFLNLYRNGYDHVGWMSENHPALRDEPSIASVSLGVTRLFEMQRKDGSGFLRFPLFPGSLLLMEGATQEDWQHQFPKQPNVASERINITFRKMYMIEGLTV